MLGKWRPQPQLGCRGMGTLRSGPQLSGGERPRSYMEDDLKHTKLSVIRLTFWLTKCDRGDTRARKSLFYQARTFMRAAQSLKSHHQTRRFGFRHGSNARCRQACGSGHGHRMDCLACCGAAELHRTYCFAPLAWHSRGSKEDDASPSAERASGTRSRKRLIQHHR